MITDQTLSRSNLAAAFEIFNELSSSLGDSYRELENRVSELTRELAEARSERLRELAEKERLANRLSTLLSVLPGGVVTIDANRMVREANPQAQDILGTGKPLTGRLWPEVLAEVVQENSEGSHDLKTTNGKRISLCERVLDAAGNEVILLTDVTEHYALQEMENRERRLTALGEMSARLAHQLRTPLSSALLYISRLAHLPVEDEGSSRIVARVIDRLRHIEKLIDGMLMFVRGDTRSRSEFSVAAMMEELVGIVLPAAQERGGTVDLKLPDRDTCITGNREALLSGLVNIVENSITASEQPEVTVSLLYDRESVEFCIEDRGPGFGPGVVEKVFDPFFTTRSNGTGLGLAIAAVVAKEHGGGIDAGNIEGGGARVRLKIRANMNTGGAERNE